MPILNNLMSQKTRTKLDTDEYGYLGINGQNVSSDATMLYGIPAGVYVTGTISDGPAEKAGLQEGDIITAFDGITITSMQDLQNRLQYYAAGESVDLTVATKSSTPGAGYESKIITAVLGDRKDLQ